jgi:hypothetical protein
VKNTYIIEESYTELKSLGYYYISYNAVPKNTFKIINIANPEQSAQKRDLNFVKNG